MRRFSLVLISSLALMLSCKKSSTNPYSYWHVNKDSFSTNDVYVDVGKLQTNFATRSFINGFGFGFHGGYVGDIALKLDCSTQNPEWVCFYIYYNDTNYYAKTNKWQTINKTTIKNGLTRYTLDSTWLFNVYNFQDSVFKDSILVSGVFNEPYSN